MTFKELKVGDTFDYEIDGSVYSFIKIDCLHIDILNSDHIYGDTSFVNSVCISDEGCDKKYLGFLFLFESNKRIFHVNYERV